MKAKYFLVMIALVALIGAVHAEKFTPDEGIFAFQEVSTVDINGVNFTIPTSYDVTFVNSTQMEFRHDDTKLKISVMDDGKIRKVKENRSKNLTSGKTMLGSVDGYLVDRNGTYTFSYEVEDKLVVIKSKDMALMIGVMENNTQS